MLILFHSISLYSILNQINAAFVSIQDLNKIKPYNIFLHLEYSAALCNT